MALALLKLITILFTLVDFAPTLCTPATAHLHSKSLSAERDEDGAYVGRNAHHISDQGEHNVEFDHEAILGSVKDAEEFDTLKPEESKKRLAVLVKQMDLDKDGYVDRKELKAWIIRSFKLLSEEEANERFEDIDEDQDQRISWDEYVRDSFGVEQVNSDDPADRIIADDKEMFNVADQNRDGFLDKSEFVVFNHPEEHPQTLPILLKHALRDKDADNDGYVSFQEFIGTRGESQDQEWIVTEKDKFDNDYDKNHDGVLDNAEVLSWLVPSNDEIADDEVAHLFAASDDDHDDLLSYHEVVEHYDTFVGSEATDYGDQLQNMNHLEDEL